MKSLKNLAGYRALLKRNFQIGASRTFPIVAATPGERSTRRSWARNLAPCAQVHGDLRRRGAVGNPHQNGCRRDRRARASADGYLAGADEDGIDGAAASRY